MAAPRGRGRAWEQPRAAQHTGDAASRHGACAAATEPPHPARVPHPRSGAGEGGAARLQGRRSLSNGAGRTASFPFSPAMAA